MARRSRPARCSPTSTRATRSRRRARSRPSPPPTRSRRGAAASRHPARRRRVACPSCRGRDRPRELAPAPGGSFARARRDPRPAPDTADDLFEVAEELEGDRIVAVERRGKYLVLRLESGLGLLVHLRMTGGFHCAARDARAGRARARRRYEDSPTATCGASGRGSCWRTPSSSPYLAATKQHKPLGARFTPDWLGGSARPAPRAAEGRSFSTSGSCAGLGNIYADEALWRARVNPRARRTSSRRKRSPRGPGHPGLRSETGIERQGSTLSDYAAPDGTRPERCRTSFASTDATGEPCSCRRATIAKPASAAAGPGSARAASLSRRRAASGCRRLATLDRREPTGPAPRRRDGSRRAPQSQAGRATRLRAPRRD